MQDDFMIRLDTEYQAYIAGLTERPKSEIIERAGEIAGMTEIYQYLKKAGVIPSHEEYLSQVAHPLSEIYGFYSAYPPDHSNHIDLTIYDICDKDMFSDPEIEKFHVEHPIRFHRKPSTLEELKTFRKGEKSDDFKVEKIIDLTPEQFLHFTHTLLIDSPFIAENKDSMWLDGACWHCLLVRSEGASESILVESERYNYARYCAFVPEYSKLDLKDVPVERYGDNSIQKHKPDPHPER